jgi:hypothetical protein
MVRQGDETFSQNVVSSALPTIFSQRHFYHITSIDKESQGFGENFSQGPFS